MNAFKGKDWARAALEKIKRLFSKARYTSLTERIRDERPLHRAESLMRVYKVRILQGVGALGLLASISIGGNEYVKLHTYEVYHVYVEDQFAGTVSDPKIVEDYIINRVKHLEESNPDVHMVLNTDDITYKAEKAYKIKSDDQSALANLDGMLEAHAVGVEIVVDGNPVAVVRDKEEAEAILQQLQQKYAPVKESGRVSVLSAPPQEQELDAGQSVLESVGFLEQVDLKIKKIEPQDVMDPQEVLQKLETGGVAPSQYTVQSGDCVSCIAQKLGISKQVIYEKNPWIVDDKIRVGDVLDVTVYKPTLTVKTVEKVVENLEIPYETIYEEDNTMRKGTTSIISPGKNGLKKVTYLVTKGNGTMLEEELVDEQIIEEPVPAYAKKGTKVVLGQGTGKFVWPVVGAKLTSYYGKRWGKMHKGIDMVGNKNILAADNGVVTYAGNKGDGYGNKVVIDHKNGYTTVYAHLSKIETSKGKVVEKGEKIGVMGSTGDSTGVHLHFEILRNGAAQNPLQYLSR